MKFRIFMATATAASVLMMGAAMADDNWAKVTQHGDDNSASVSQDAYGSGNQTRILQGQVGEDGNRNTVDVDQTGTGNLAGFQWYGDEQWTLRQYGHDNLITIQQTGRNNEVGMDNGNRYGGRSGYVSFFGGVGVEQTGSQNILNVQQNNGADTYSENAVGAVRQTGDIGATATTNEAIVFQGTSVDTKLNGPRHYVGFISQNNSGAGTSSSLKNYVNINQTGGGHPNPNGYDGQHIYNVTQDGVANFADLDQHGHTNRITLIEQLGTDNSATVSQVGFGNVVIHVKQNNEAGGTLGNQATLTFDGDYNGTDGFTSLSAAASVGLTQATAEQLGDDNLLNYTVTGNSNLFAFKQVNDHNEIQGLVDGDFNEVAVAQTGDNNYAFAQQVGANNNIGISQ